MFVEPRLSVLTKLNTINEFRIYTYLCVNDGEVYIHDIASKLNIKRKYVNQAVNELYKKYVINYAETKVGMKRTLPQIRLEKKIINEENKRESLPLQGVILPLEDVGDKLPLQDNVGDKLPLQDNVGVKLTLQNEDVGDKLPLQTAILPLKDVGVKLPLQDDDSDAVFLATAKKKDIPEKESLDLKKAESLDLQLYINKGSFLNYININKDFYLYILNNNKNNINLDLININLYYKDINNLYITNPCMYLTNKGFNRMAIALVNYLLIRMAENNIERKEDKSWYPKQIALTQTLLKTYRPDQIVGAIDYYSLIEPIYGKGIATMWELKNAKLTMKALTYFSSETPREMLKPLVTEVKEDDIDIANMSNEEFALMAAQDFMGGFTIEKPVTH